MRDAVPESDFEIILQHVVLLNDGFTEISFGFAMYGENIEFNRPNIPDPSQHSTTKFLDLFLK